MRSIEVIIILNGSSRAASENEKLIKTIEEALHRRAADATIWVADSGEAVPMLLERAAASTDDTVVAGGGDGTVNSIATAVAGSAKRMGVLPLGTLNHFAKDLGLPLALDAAIDVLLNGRETEVDVGEVNGRIFLNNSSLGFYPRVVRRREEQRERLGRGKWPAFAWAVLSALHVCPTLRLRLRANGQERMERTPFLFIGNNAYRMDILGIGSRERLDGGALSAYYARGAGRWGVIRLALRSLVGRLAQTANFETIHTAQLHVEMRRRMVDVSLDGEVFRLEPPLVYRIRPRALRVVVPATDKK